MHDGHPIAFLCQALNMRNQARSTYEKECLMHLSDQQLTTGLQHKAFVHLMGLQYTIQYKQGISNAADDELLNKL